MIQDIKGGFQGKKMLTDSKIKIRVATVKDAKALLDIYAYYVKHTAITFEYDVPTVEEFEKRIERVLEKYPYLVAILEDEIVGYAYASAFHERPACGWAVETSIYVDKDKKGLGIGKKLYEVLEEILKLQNVLNLEASIAYNEIEDEYLTKDSVKFHEKLGYCMVGRFVQCGYKFNRWYDLVWMEKHIGEHTNKQETIKSFSEVRDKILDREFFKNAL